MKITYPIGWRGTEPIYFGALVGGVHLTDADGHFDYASAVRLTYNVRDGPVGEVSERWRKRVAEVKRANKEMIILIFKFLSNKEDRASGQFCLVLECEPLN